MKKFKEHSHIRIDEIERLQRKYRKEILQPRLENGELNPEFLKEYGLKNIRITLHDVLTTKKKNPEYGKILTKAFEEQKQQKWEL